MKLGLLELERDVRALRERAHPVRDEADRRRRRGEAAHEEELRQHVAAHPRARQRRSCGARAQWCIYCDSSRRHAQLIVTSLSRFDVTKPG